MSFELFLCLKQLKAKRKQKFISIISAVSVLGIAIGVCALIVVISVMNGFDRELMNKILGMNAHLSLEHPAGIVSYNSLIKKLEADPEIVAASPNLFGQVIVRKGNQVNGVILKGVDFAKESAVTDLHTFLKSDPPRQYLQEDFEILIGKELARNLRIKLGDTVQIISPVSMVKSKRRKPLTLDFTVSGIFHSQMYEYDANFVFVSLKDAQKLLALERDVASHIQLKLSDFQKAPLVKTHLAGEFSPPFSLRTWYDKNQSLFSALKLEKTAMFVILILITLVAAFNIASTMIMVVMEKSKEIAVLKSLGASRRSILKIFCLEGLMIGVLGSVLGLALGLGLAHFLSTSSLISLPSDVYYVSTLPVEMRLKDISVIMLSAFVLTLVSTIYPALQAARLDPVESLRYE